MVSHCSSLQRESTCISEEDGSGFCSTEGFCIEFVGDQDFSAGAERYAPTMQLLGDTEEVRVDVGTYYDICPSFGELTDTSCEQWVVAFGWSVLCLTKGFWWVRPGFIKWTRRLKYVKIRGTKIIPWLCQQLVCSPFVRFSQCKWPPLLLLLCRGAKATDIVGVGGVNATYDISKDITLRCRFNPAARDQVMISGKGVKCLWLTCGHALFIVHAVLDNARYTRWGHDC